MFRNALVRSIWALADPFAIIQGGLICLASKAVSAEEPSWMKLVEHYTKPKVW